LSALEGALIYPAAAKAGLAVPTANRNEFDVIQQISRPRVSSFISERERKVQLHRSYNPNQFDCATELHNELLMFLQYMVDLLCKRSFWHRR
jgi:hypothetical protein